MKHKDVLPTDEMLQIHCKGGELSKELGEIKWSKWDEFDGEVEHAPFQRREEVLRDCLHRVWSTGSEHSHRLRNCPPV